MIQGIFFARFLPQKGTFYNPDTGNSQYIAYKSLDLFGASRCPTYISIKADTRDAGLARPLQSYFLFVD